MPRSLLGRRAALRLPAGLLLGAAPGTALGASPAALPEAGAGTVPGAVPATTLGGATFLVPGPDGGGASRWAERFAQRGTRGPAPRLNVVGGADGVTAANRFATTAAGDGRLLLVMPGSVPMAALSGSERANYTLGGWTPLCLSWQPVLIAGRGPVPVGQNRPPLRFALPSPDSAEGGAILLLESLGQSVTPVALPAGGVNVTAEAGFAARALDAVLLTGRDVLARAASLGATPWYGGPAGPAALPSLTEPVREAAAAALGSAQLQAALMLPALTPADTVAAWRQAATRWREAAQAEPVAGEGEPLVGAEAAATLASLAPAPPSVLCWRDWLSRRLGWRPA
ncbi:hypothetical protein [Roseomonas elaeocarpi]|uniref:Twin-arginine translocation pathway signal protein n=1 Tax=Roseomonas elaeocarpi TaxID=907779 RepID=A0ABV6JSN8_9PROT